MEKDLYITEAPQSETPDTTILPQKQTHNISHALPSPYERRCQITKKILSNFPSQAYYEDKKIKPGISLYKVILETEDKRKQGEYKGPFLKMNMSPSVAFTDNVNSMIYCQSGLVKTVNYVTYEQFLDHINVSEADIAQPDLVPKIIVKSCNGINFQHNIYMNNEINPLRIIPRNQNVICTNFSNPYAMYPNIIRLFFIPSHIKTTKKNTAYKVINKKQLTQELFNKKHRITNNYFVNIESEDSYVATLMKGKALKPCEEMAASLVDYLEHALLISIGEMVIDFVVDENKTIWFHEIKSVRSKNKTKLWEIASQEQIEKIAKQNNNQIMCRLCGMLYTRQQMQKLVTNKLIYELSAHLQNRGKKLSNIPHLKKDGLSNVCHLCYELIKAQHQLINVERQFSKLMNIRQNTIERVQSKQSKQHHLFFYNEEQFQALGEQTSKYKKWRLFFFIEKLKRIPQFQLLNLEDIDVSLEMKFQNQKEKFSTMVKNQNYNPQVEKYRGLNRSRGKKNTHQVRDSSRVKKSSMIRVQSALPLKRQTHNPLEQSFMQVQTPSTHNVQINTAQTKNKSYYNDQTTCVTHSQSYFSNANNSLSFSYDTTQQFGSNLTKINNFNLASLNEDSEENGENIFKKQQESYSLNTSMFKKNPRNTKTKKSFMEQYNLGRISEDSLTPIELESVNIDKVKMFIFYTKEHENAGQNILQDEQLDFTLTFTPKEKNHSRIIPQAQGVKFTGKSHTLKNLKNKDICQRHSSEVYLFDQGMKYCNLELTVGIICDGVFDDQGLDLIKHNNLYWGNSYSCDPLPDEWMEVFTNGEEVPKCNPEKVLQILEANNFCMQPPKVMSKTASVNYLRSFESTINSFASSTSKNIQSSTNLKKTSLTRCRTALTRNGNNFGSRNFRIKQNNFQIPMTQEQSFPFDV